MGQHYITSFVHTCTKSDIREYVSYEVKNITSCLTSYHTITCLIHYLVLLYVQQSTTAARTTLTLRSILIFSVIHEALGNLWHLWHPVCTAVQHSSKPSPYRNCCATRQSEYRTCITSYFLILLCTAVQVVYEYDAVSLS